MNGNEEVIENLKESVAKFSADLEQIEAQLKTAQESKKGKKATYDKINVEFKHVLSAETGNGPYYDIVVEPINVSSQIRELQARLVEAEKKGFSEEDIATIESQIESLKTYLDEAETKANEYYEYSDKVIAQHRVAQDELRMINKQIRKLTVSKFLTSYRLGEAKRTLGKEELYRDAGVKRGRR